MKPVLLLVDLQNDYLGAAALEPSANQIVENAAALLSVCRERSIPAVHVWTTVSRDDDRRMPHWRRAERWICERGTTGHATPGALRPRPGETVIPKTFFSAFSNPELELFLRSEKIDTVIIAGIHLHACVRQTVIDAYQLGFEVWVADDATGSDDPVHAAITRRYLQSRAARFANARALQAMIEDDLRFPHEASPEAEKVSAAALRAHQTALEWARIGLAARAAVLDRLAASLEDRAEKLAVQMARDLGKPVHFGETEIRRTAEMLRAVVRRASGAIAHPQADGEPWRRVPHGVVAVITPWNNPSYIALGKIGPAMVHGNAVVWKPAPAAEPVSRELLEMMRAAGLPRDVVHLVCGDRATAEALMNDPRVSAVTITASTRAGHGATEICARRHIPLQAELGGNNAAIIWPDANLPDAARRVAEGAFEMAGQRCTANRRVIVHENCREQFLELLLREAGALRWGDPLDHDIRVGPVVSAIQRDRVASMVQRAARDFGQPRQPHGTAAPAAGHVGCWYPPTLVFCDDPCHEIVQEETFGPVLVVQAARDWNHAISLCNGVRQGLAAAVFTSSAEITDRFLDEAQAGIVKVNRSTADADVDAPFGGWKASGIGPPEHGIFDREFYTRPQTCYRGSRDSEATDL